MTDFDANQYERRQNRAIADATRQLRELIELDRYGDGPVVEFLCPKGHSLKHYRVADDNHDGLQLVALPGLVAKRGPITRNASPWTHGKAVCQAPGCPHSVPCDEHPQQPEQLDSIRTEFVCPTCRWSDKFTAARLMKVYGTAVVLGRKSVPITFSGSSARRPR